MVEEQVNLQSRFYENMYPNEEELVVVIRRGLKKLKHN